MTTEIAEAQADALYKVIKPQLKTPAKEKAFLKLLDKALIKKNPFLLITDGHLTIKPKQMNAPMAILRLKKAQKRVFDVIYQLWLDNKIIRILILKARQTGISTLIEAILYAITSQTENINSLIISKDKEGSDYIFEMSKLYQEQLNPAFKPKEKKSNEKKLEFESTHSQLMIDTAADSGAGRGTTLQLVHLSEYAFFRKARELMLAVSQAVPAMSRTIIIKESTANGFNFFRDEYHAAEKGQNDYVPIFIPWYWDEDYRMTVTDDFQVGDPSLGEISQDEFILREQMQREGIDFIEERLVWRRWCVRNNCAGSILKFHQEYPSTAREAFVATGDTYFDKTQLLRMLDALPQVKSFKADIVEVDNGFELRKDANGVFVFYEEPQADRRFQGAYTVAGDCSSGSGLDYSYIEACRCADGKTIATFHGKIEPDQMEEYVYLLGSYLNKALVAIENEKFGFAVNNSLKKRYGNIYRPIRHRDLDQVKTDKFGWETNSLTRPMMISALEEDIRQGAKDIPEERAIMECFTFIRNPETKKVEAAEGCNDDTVMTMAINSALRRIHPYVPPVVPVHDDAERKPNRGFGWKK